MKPLFLIWLAAMIMSLSGVAGAVTYFSDDFESYADTAAVTSAGWTIANTAAATEVEAQWFLFDSATTAALLGLPAGFHFGPATRDGGTTPGNYLFSFSDELPGFTAPEGPDNPVDQDASHDVTTPSFSTAGGSGDVWLHVDVSAQLGDGGDAVFDVDVSVNGGNSWSNVFRRVAPGRSATTIPDTNDNAGGHHGNLDLNLGSISGQSDVRVRFRHFEQTDDEFIAFDNVVVDDVAPLGSGPAQAFLEDFNDLTLGQMGVYEYVHLMGFFGTDSGAGGVSGFSWGTEDRPSPGRPDGRYQAGTVGTKNVNRLGHPTAEVNNHVPFAIIDSAAEEDGQDPAPDSFQSERLHTPILDLTEFDTVILEWDEEVIYDGNPAFGSVASVVLMQDDGDGIPGATDTIVNEPDKFADILARYFPYDQFGGGSFSGGDDPTFGHRLLDISADAAGRDDIYIAFQYASADTDYWAIDNVRITGSGPSVALYGDYNDDGVVNAADYVVWRNNEGTSFNLPNRDPSLTGNIGPDDYDFWVENFGATGGSGSGSNSIPEPASLLLWGLAAAGKLRRPERKL